MPSPVIDWHVVLVDAAGNNFSAANPIPTTGGAVSQATKTDDSAFVVGSDGVLPIGYLFDDVATDTVDEGDVGVARMSGDRIVYGRVQDGHDVNQGATTDAANTTGATGTMSGKLRGLVTILANVWDSINGRLKVDGSGVTQPVSGTVSVTEPVSVDDNAGSLTVDTPQLPAALVGGRVDVNVGNTPAVQGDVAHDVADSGNPVKVGLKAIAHGANPAAVAAGERTNWYGNRAGVPFVIGGHPNVQTIRANYTAAQTNTAIVTVATGNKIVVTRVLVTADDSNTVDVSVIIGFGTTTTPTTTGVVASHPGVPKGGGFNTGDGSGVLGIGADDEDLRITSSVPTGGSIDCVISYYTIES